MWQHMAFDRTQDRFAIIDYDTPGALSGRLGVRLAGAFAAGGMMIKPSLTANLWHEILGTDKTTFSGTALRRAARTRPRSKSRAGFRRRSRRPWACGATSPISGTSLSPIKRPGVAISACV
ncbi:autotransporter domain-containing protein [Chelatococcus sp. GW1]|uniref:autotransporter domain-containing protein n=1 Tax=unclassified Chelatococcus TaxID=2638111 RepID=UPI0002EE2876